MISMDSNFFLDQVELPPGRHIFDTLLHECLHAILALYCHRDPTTSPPGIFPATGIERLGLTGHGSIWTELGSHVEFTAQCFLNRDIDLGLAEGVLHEARVSGQVPSVKSTLRWHGESREEIMTKYRQLAARRIADINAAKATGPFFFGSLKGCMLR
ncbi:uncharacterized protein RCC_07986 [Ramularia collo-cygni]|uniref:Uncharacterized protein n=1 Tax=Ramularia collo-cygni TaxID=112498 RepID=A0A2D3VBD6_9PEZI|nr:uncharacterized protein RCC_07986 [Ramularia collo-cygni]CZT22117.1 uncharacterized protein RCC_07986 [Ramularia collo-cygni]